MVAVIENTLEELASETLEEVLKGGCVQPVYQPIVSLQDGQVFGYEALSRVYMNGFRMSIEEMFKTADREHRAWELEALCRTKALKNAIYMEADKKLFINVNPNIIHDTDFRNGFTKSYLKEFGLNFSDVVFEITERVMVSNKEAFLASIEHYKSQNYGIAVDDVGSGYSGLNILYDVKPNFIKLDMGIVRDIDKDETKQLLCKAMVDFAKNSDIAVIAEGIETEEELETLIKLNVDLGQGYFLAIPNQTFTDVAPDIVELINNFNTKKYVKKNGCSVYPIIGHLAKPGHCFSPDEIVGDIYEAVRRDQTITEFTVLKGNTPVGFITRTELNEMLGGKYGFTLYSGKPVSTIMKSDFLKISHTMPVDQVSRLAMQRPFERLYNPIVIEQKGEYLGIVTVKDLLSACTKVEVDIATDSNPLTNLPGNLVIEKEIMSRIFGKNAYCIIYFDIDNFKAYNDAYGFQNGDIMLAYLANILKKCATRNEFVGHIGGDDFIVICDYHEGENLCTSILNKFAAQIGTLYHDEDIENGYYISKNRNGVTENFPIASLSVAGITNRANSYQSIDDFSNDIAELKKIAKKHFGNYFEIH
jgi:diguanylate cyclase (GGDEF)-like protein